MNEKFTYYADFGSGFELFQPYIDHAKLIYRRDAEFPALIQITVEGDFRIIGDLFDTINTIYQTQGNVDIPLKIYENGNDLTGTLIFNGMFSDYNEFDYNKSTVKINKMVSYTGLERYVIEAFKNKTNIWNLYFGSFYAWNDMYDMILDSVIPLTLSEASFSLMDTLNNALNNGTNILPFIVPLDDSDEWIGSELIALDNIRLCPVATMGFFGVDWFGITIEELTVEEILKNLQNMFNIFWCIDDSKIKFKTPSDLISNTLDVTSINQHLDSCIYNLEKFVKKDKYEFHPNNNTLESGDTEPDVDFENPEITYNRSAVEINEFQITFQTKVTVNDGIEKSGWFCGFVNPSDDKIRKENGYASGIEKHNGRFSGANLLDNYHRDYLWTDKANFSICGTSSTEFPTHYQSFIDLPELITTLPVFDQFYDSLLWKSSGGIDTYALVYEQSLDLTTNQTSFKTKLFSRQ